MSRIIVWTREGRFVCPRIGYDHIDPGSPLYDVKPCKDCVLTPVPLPLGAEATGAIQDEVQEKKP